MTETTEIKALTEANGTMDAIYVDDNDSATYLPDLINGLTAEEEEHGGATVLVETDGPGKLVLTRMEGGYRAGHYGTILDVDHPEAARY